MCGNQACTPEVCQVPAACQTPCVRPPGVYPVTSPLTRLSKVANQVETDRERANIRVGCRWSLCHGLDTQAATHCELLLPLPT